jgi:hypothetical protein
MNGSGQNHICEVRSVTAWDIIVFFCIVIFKSIVICHRFHLSPLIILKATPPTGQVSQSYVYSCYIDDQIPRYWDEAPGVEQI